MVSTILIRRRALVGVAFVFACHPTDAASGGTTTVIGSSSGSAWATSETTHPQDTSEASIGSTSDGSSAPGTADTAYTSASTTGGDLPQPDCSAYRNTLESASIDQQVDVAAIENVECIVGELRVANGAGGDDVVDLSPLHALSDVGLLNFSRASELTDLTGLEGLRVIRGGAYFGYFGPDFEECAYNASLQNLDALAGLESISVALDICGAHKDSLESIAGLNTALQGDIDYIANLSQLDHLASIDAFSGVTSIAGLNLFEMPALVDVSGLGDLTTGVNVLIESTALEDLHGLEMLLTLDGRFTLTNNPQLVTLAGLDALVSVEQIVISNNPLLPQAEAEALLASLEIGDMGVACGNLDGPPC